MNIHEIMNKIEDCSGLLLGKESMDEYPLAMSLGLFLLSISIWNYKRKYNIPQFDV